MGSTPTLQGSLALPPTCPHLHTLPLWPSSPRMFPTCPPHRQVRRRHTSARLGVVKNLGSQEVQSSLKSTLLTIMGFYQSGVLVGGKNSSSLVHEREALLLGIISIRVVYSSIAPCCLQPCTHISPLLLSAEQS